MNSLLPPKALPNAARASPSCADCTISLPTSLQNGPSYSLRESERAVVRLFGSGAISELRDLGERCKRDGAFTATVVRIGSPEADPEGWAKLATVIPDYLIAAYTLRTFLGGAVRSDFARGIPHDGQSLLAVALGLQRFSNQADLQYAVRTERGQALVPGAEPIFSRLSPAVLDTLRTRQRAGYELRLGIQPGGREILASLNTAESPFSRNMTRVISALLAEAMLQLDPSDGAVIRALSRDYHNKRWVPFSREDIAHKRLTGLRASDGSVFSPPPDLVERVSVMHNTVWGRTRPLVEGPSVAPRSAAHAMRALEGAVPPELLEYNLDTIAALTWMLAIGLMEDAHYESLTGTAGSPLSLDTSEQARSVQGNAAAELNYSLPAPTVLKSDDGAVELPEPIEPISKVAQVKEEPTIKPIVFIAGREIERPEIIRLVGDLEDRIKRELFSLDLRQLQPVLTHIDNLPGDIRDPSFLKAMQQLRSTHQYRAKYIESITVGLLASDAESLSVRRSEILDSLLHQNNRLHDRLLDAIPAWQRQEVNARRLELHQHKERIITDLGSQPERLLPLTELLDPARSHLDLPVVKDLLEPHVIDEYGTERYKSSGGIFASYPFLTALEETFPGYVLVRRKMLMDTNALDGMFIYGRPGVYPSQLAELLTIIAPNKDLSIAGLFITARDRAQGTYMSLLKGMAARLALEGARYSLGIVGELNLKHHDLLLQLDHKPLKAASLYAEKLEARYLPMLWEVP